MIKNLGLKEHPFIYLKTGYFKHKNNILYFKENDKRSGFLFLIIESNKIKDDFYNQYKIIWTRKGNGNYIIGESNTNEKGDFFMIDKNRIKLDTLEYNHIENNYFLLSFKGNSLKPHLIHNCFSHHPFELKLNTQKNIIINWNNEEKKLNIIQENLRILLFLTNICLYKILNDVIMCAISDNIFIRMIIINVNNVIIIRRFDLISIGKYKNSKENSSIHQYMGCSWIFDDNN